MGVKLDGVVQHARTVRYVLHNSGAVSKCRVFLTSANRNLELECRGLGKRSKIQARKSKIAAERSCEGACFRKVFLALFFGSTGLSG